jgi:hypothetical protein
MAFMALDEPVKCWVKLIVHCPKGPAKQSDVLKNEREGNFLNAIVREVNGDRDKAKRGVPHAVDQVSISCEDTIVEKWVSFY